MRLALSLVGVPLALAAHPSTTRLARRTEVHPMPLLADCSPACCSREFQGPGSGCCRLSHHASQRCWYRLPLRDRFRRGRASKAGMGEGLVADSPPPLRSRRRPRQTRPACRTVGYHPCCAPDWGLAVAQRFPRLDVPATCGQPGVFSGLLPDPASDLAGRHVQRAAARPVGAANRRQAGRCAVSGRGLPVRRVEEAGRSTRDCSSSIALSAHRYQMLSRQDDSELCSVDR